MAPRYQVIAMQPTPVHMQGVKGLFRTSNAPGAGPRCVIALHDPHVFKCVGAALAAVQKLTADLLREYSD